MLRRGRDAQSIAMRMERMAVDSWLALRMSIYVAENVSNGAPIYSLSFSLFRSTLILAINLFDD